MSRSGSAGGRHVRVLVAGGGVAALEATLALRALAAERVEVELLAPERCFSYRPLAVLEPFTVGRAHRIELSRLAEQAGAALRVGALAAVDPEARVARTATGVEIPFDALLLACGARPQTAPSGPGTLMFRGSADAAAYRALFAEIETGAVGRVAFVLPAVGWPLPLYELALLTAAHLASRGIRECELVLVTHEPRPLSLFGRAASDSVQALLEARDITVVAGRCVTGYDGEALTLVPPPSLPAQRVVTLPRLEGQPIAGVPRDAAGFVPVDEFARVPGLPGVFAAGDITTFPVKQGGIAAQAADVAAEMIAARAGAPVVPRPFRPVLRGLLFTGSAPTFMRADLAAGGGEAAVSTQPLWWPPAKIVGRHLAPVLARTLRYGETAPPSGGIPVQVDLG